MGFARRLGPPIRGCFGTDRFVSIFVRFYGLLYSRSTGLGDGSDKEAAAAKVAVTETETETEMMARVRRRRWGLNGAIMVLPGRAQRNQNRDQILKREISLLWIPMWKMPR